MPSLEESHILPLYAVPVLSHVWDGAGPVNEALREAIFAREKSHPGLKKSNAGGYHSTEDLHTWSGDAGQTLFGWVIEALNHATSELFAQDNLHEEFGWGVAIWANINRTGEANKLHTHPGSTWSGVYYVDTGDGVPDRPESGRITFINPLLAERSSFFTPHFAGQPLRDTGRRADDTLPQLSATYGADLLGRAAEDLDRLQRAQGPVSINGRRAA